MSRPHSQALHARAAPDFAALEQVSCFDWSVLLSPDSWLGHQIPKECFGVSGENVRGIAAQSEIGACFEKRKVPEPDGSGSIIGKLLDADVACISHSLSALLSMSDENARQLMPPVVRNVVGDNPVSFDHIGIEVFGKLEWYIDLISSAYRHIGVDVEDQRVFPSTQVRQALSYDPELQDVRIGRVFFASGDSQVNLEIFEATQSWQYIALRQASLYAHLKSPISRPKAVRSLTDAVGTMLQPVGHVAFRVHGAETVEAIQAVLVRESNRDGPVSIRPYSAKAFVNPSDGSINTKFAVSVPLPSGQRIGSHIVEILSYDV